MWDDIIIGKGSKGANAWLALNMLNGGTITQNGTSYWVSDAYLGTGLTIFKDTAEGQRLTKLLELKTMRARKVENFMDALVIKHLKPTQLKRKISEVQSASYERGIKDQRTIMRAALGLN